MMASHWHSQVSPLGHSRLLLHCGALQRAKAAPRHGRGAGRNGYFLPKRPRSVAEAVVEYDS